MTQKKVGLYIHIPFCKRACFYCHFTRYPYDSVGVERYVAALVQELRLHAGKEVIIDSIYLGGGSPSLLNETQISRIIETITRYFRVSVDSEVSMELNPEDVSREKLCFLKGTLINRLSIGTQSFCEADLRYLKRSHTVVQSERAVDIALDVGFRNINIDFIIGLPTQTSQTLAQSFSFLEKYPIPHISAYLLEGMEDTEDDDQIEMLKDHYFFTHDHLGGMGYRHYEVSNFSRESGVLSGYQSRHNLKYWHNEDYIGVGVSASGFENGKDYKNAVDFGSYFRFIEKGEFPVEEVSGANISLRRIVMGLRLLEGIPESAFELYSEPVEFLIGNGFLRKCNGNIGVPFEKILVLNEILGYFF